MGLNIKFTETQLPGVLVVEPVVFHDARGFLMESFNTRRYLQEAGIHLSFVQDNVSKSKRGVLRGLHYQRAHPQGKLVQVLAGVVYDVVVDINPQSATFGQYTALELSAENHRQVWIPPGYAHGFCVISDTAIFQYKCTDYYQPEDEAGLAWNCPTLAIPWPVDNPILSEKDQQHPGL